MRILLIDQYAGSPYMGMEYRPFCLAREWMQRGDRVLIIAGSYSHLRRKNPLQGGGAYREARVRFWMIPTPCYQNNGWRRVKNIFHFARGLFRMGDRLAKTFRPDVVICASTHPFDFGPAKRIAKKSGAVLLFELHDIWPLSLIELYGFAAGHPLMRLIEYAERCAFLQSDGVVTLLPGLKQYLDERGITPQRLLCIANGSVCDLVEQENTAPIKTLEQLQLLRERYGALVVYAGGFARANALEKLISLAQQLPQVGFAAIGEGCEKMQIQERAPSNLSLFKAVVPSALLPLLQSADLLWLATEDYTFYRYGVAMNKLFDYMSAGRPVVFETPCLKNPISESGCGITVSPSDKIKTRQVIERLLLLSPAERGAMGERGRRAVAGRYGYPTLAKRYRGFLEELINGKREG